ncbi:hypothetical protein T440DRAFT_108212 [Plenodomus tracheiphilus IPT5]|uniref:F-box domain-containing protein n=1 Tax=Plenodomus tracheiphilus IPT5 TaxID=1408161 RepID=A0A6A7BLV8_9PLEO|nr:hypothetical protein T440DRAFT_108212 [Plenodomus tracheiphilus IPT5]
MDTTQPPSQSHFSFSRFSEKIRDSTKRRQPQSQHQNTNTNNETNTKHHHNYSYSYSHTQPPLDKGHTSNKQSLTLPSSDPFAFHSNTTTATTTTDPIDPTRDRRRSSVANYTSHIRSLFTPSPHPPFPTPQKTTLLSLPTELVSKILSHLPFYTLLHARAISPTFTSLIPGSDPLLAEKLYLRPSRSLQVYELVPATFDFDMDITSHSVEDGEQPAGVRFSKGVRRQISMGRRTMGLIRMSEEIVFHPVILDFNTFITKPGFCAAGPPAGQRRGGEEGKGVGTGTHSVLGVERDRAQSWRNMLVSMPPLREIRIRHARTRAVIKLIRVGDEGEGITLGMVFDALGEWSAGSG